LVKDPRELAILCMNQVEDKHQLVPEAISEIGFRLSHRDRMLAHELIYGSFRYLPGLQRVLAGYLAKPEKLPRPVYWTLVVSLYQLHYTRVPAYAAIDRANRLARKLGFSKLTRLVNGVLRNIARALPGPFDALKLKDQLLPPWMQHLIVDQYGEATLDAWAGAWQERPTMAAWLASGEVPDGWRRSDVAPNAWLSTGSGGKLPPTMYVQNESSQWVAEWALALAPKTALDLCAAPGGKSCYLSRFGELNRLVAVEKSELRARIMDRNRDRLGLDFEVVVQDGLAAELSERVGGPFDLVLVDAPCSALGIIGRHPEIKFLRDASSSAKVRETQAALVESAWRMVAPGGHLVYAVCSFDRSELPSPPADGVRTDLELDSGHLPLRLESPRFLIEPSSRMDGFSGFVVRKASR